MHNMFITRNGYEVAILAYFEQGGMEKTARWPISLNIYSRGNTAHSYKIPRQSFASATLEDYII